MSKNQGHVDRAADRIEATEARRKSETEQTTRRKRAERLQTQKFDAALANVQSGKAPDLKGMTGVGGMVVTDPFSEGKATKIVALRNDPLLLMHVRGTINEIQLNAGRAYQRHWNEAEIGGAKAINYEIEHVDGCQPSGPDDVRIKRALLELAKIDRALGEDGADLCALVLGHNKPLAQIAQDWAMTDQLAYKYLRRRFVECLDRIAQKKGFAQGPARGPVRKADQYDDLAQHADNPKLRTAVRLAKA